MKQIMKALGLAIILLLLGSIAPSLAQQAPQQTPAASAQAPAQKPPGCDPQEYNIPKEIKNQDEIDKLKQRVQIVCNAMKALGVINNDPAKPMDRDRGLRVGCNYGQTPMNCGLSGYVGAILQLRWDQKPGVKGFQVFVSVPDAGAVKNRGSREEMIKKEQANQSGSYTVWDMWKPSPDALLDTSRSTTGHRPHEDHQVPYGDAGGEIYLCDIEVYISGTVLGKDVLKSYSQFYGQEIVDEEKTIAASLALSTQLQGEVKAMLQSFYEAIKPAAQCAGPPATEETFNLTIEWRDDEQEPFFALPMNCCLPQQVQVVASDAKNNPVSGAQTQLYFDNVLVATRQTDQDGKAIFEVNLPDSLPKGRSQHLLKAQAQKNNGPSVVKSAAVEIARELSTIAVSLDPIGGEFFPGDAIPVSGHVWSLQNGLFMDPVKANITVHEWSTADGNTFRVSTDDGGFFQVSPIVSTNKDLRGLSPLQAETALRERLFDVRAIPVDRNKYDDASADFRVSVKTKGQLQVTAATDKGVYDQGDSVVIFGTVSADGKPIAGNVSIVLWHDGVGKRLGGIIFYEPAARAGGFSPTRCNYSRNQSRHVLRGDSGRDKGVHRQS